MKTFLSIAIIFLAQFCYSQNINFPDTNFKTALLNAGFDLDSDGEISESEALEVTKIVVAGKDISSLGGIAYFKNVSWLDIKNNKLTKLDLRSVTKLQNLYLADNQVQEILVSGLQNLSGISMARNQLTSIELQDLPRMANLYINNNPITTVNVTELENLQRINTSYTQITSLDLSQNPKMYGITVNNSDIDKIDLTGMCNLRSLNCRNTKLKTLDFTDCINLSRVLASGSELEQLKLKNEIIETIEIESLTKLKSICADADQIESINEMIADLGYTNVSVDANCSGPTALTTYYRDSDNDGFGDDSSANNNCIQPANAITRGGDCNDNDDSIFPGANEVCDNMDNNCDGNIDEGLVFITYYKDNDGDGYGDDATALEDCSQPIGMVTTAGDCDDNNVNINPSSAEIPNNDIDENCDGEFGTSVVQNISESNIQIYPNPARSFVHITRNGTVGKVELKIFSIEGRLVKAEELSHEQERLTIETHSLEEGLYTFYLRLHDQELRKRILVLKN